MESNSNKSRTKAQHVITVIASVIISLSTICYGLLSIYLLGDDSRLEIVRMCLANAIALSLLLSFKTNLGSKLTPYLLSALVITISVCEIESMKNSLYKEKTQEGREFTLQIFIVTSYFLRLRWFQAAFIHSSLTIYKFLRIIPEDWSYGIPILKLALFMALIAVLKFIEEKKESHNCEELDKAINQSLYFQNFIQNYIPNPLIIVGLNQKGEEVIHYSNEAVSSLVKAPNENHLVAELDSFRFQQIHPDEINSRKKDNLNFRSIIREILASSSNEGKQLQEFKAKILPNVKKNPKSLMHLENFSVRQINSYSNVIPDEYDNPLIMNPIIRKSDDDKFIVIPSQSKHSEKNKRYFKVKACKLQWESIHAAFFIFEEYTETVANSEIKAERRLNAINDKILANVSHKLYTHLNIILYSIENVQSQVSHLKEVHKNLKISLRSAKSLFYSLRNLFDLTKFNNKSYNNVDSGSHQVGPIIEEVVELVKFPAKTKQIKLLLNYEPCRETFVICEPEYLKRVLLSILENAIKYTANGGFIRLTAEVIMNQENIENSNINPDITDLDIFFVEFTIEDTGAGIPRMKIKTIFDFFENDNNQDMNSEDIRTGLPLSQSLLTTMLKPEHLKGSLIKVSSTEGVGSRFSFRLPLCALRNEDGRMKGNQILKLPTSLCFDNSKRISFSHYAEAEKRKSVDEKNKNAFEPQKNIRALIVDDDKINQLVLKNYLNKLDITNYETADDGEEAVIMVKTENSIGKPFHLILMDINMPKMDGYQASRNIISLSKERDIPEPFIIAITANVVINDFKKCKDCGMVAFLSKPINRKLLKQELEKIFGFQFPGN